MDLTVTSSFWHVFLLSNFLPLWRRVPYVLKILKKVRNESGSLWLFFLGMCSYLVTASKTRSFHFFTLFMDVSRCYKRNPVKKIWCKQLFRLLKFKLFWTINCLRHNMFPPLKQSHPFVQAFFPRLQYVSYLLHFRLKMQYPPKLYLVICLSLSQIT